MYSRENFIKFIPKPKNEDVILYDISLKDLIDVDVLKEYQELYPVFEREKQEYLKLREEIKVYEKNINEIYLFNPSWGETDYLKHLQDDKRTYSILYSNIKKAENNINMLNKKIQGIDEKIKIQNSKENREREKKKEDIEKDIEKNKENLARFKECLQTYKDALARIDENISENEEDFQLLRAMESSLSIGEYQCVYCGSKVNVKSENSLIYKRLYRNLEKNKLELEKLLAQKEKIEVNIAYYENEISKVKKELNNDISFKKDGKNIYIKKSIEILKLEALKDEMLNNIADLKNQIKRDSDSNSKKYLELKERIDRYETSLNNLRKINEMRLTIKEKITLYKTKEKELKEKLNTINYYISFLTIYYKIYEQKASEYCGQDYKFKFFKVEDYKIIEVFNIFYKNIEYSQLPPKVKDEVDKTLIEKFSIYF
jgi:chromosome segregation ATPase